MKISQMIREGGCQTTPSSRPLTLQDEFLVTQKVFLQNALHVFAAYLKRARGLDVVVKRTDDDIVQANIDSGEGTRVKAILQIAFVPKSMTEIRLKVKKASGDVLDERLLHDAMKQTTETVGEWVQRIYEMTYPSR